jgi:cell division protein FtsL
MATVAATIPKARPRRPRNKPAAGRATFPDTTFVKRIDNSRLRREVNREKRRECYSLLGLGILVFLFGLLYAWQHFNCVRFGYQIEQLKSEQRSLLEANRDLRLQQADLENPNRIDAVAQKTLGLAPPRPEQVIPAESRGSVAEDAPVVARNLRGTELSASDPVPSSGVVRSY